MIGTVVSHYEIVERLGGGGMGVVYRARDLRLGRSVALKFLSPRLSASPSHKQRLLREARAAAALEHPAVCTVYEVDETADGQLFLAMAFCEGETLRSRLERGPLHPVQAVDYALQVAAGLGAAHAKGIVHRDVKPANVLITPGGRLKIVDFGVAQQEDQTRLTRPGTVVGTAAYMSPEQLRGEGVDHRTDLWSLGAVLYEMAGGLLPFPGATDREIVRAIFTRDPEPLADAAPGDRLFADLDAVVARALAKRPDERYQSAEQLAAALRALPLDATAPTVIEEATRVEGFTPVPPTAERLASTPPDERPTEVSPIGATVAQFQVREPLGGGGMGVVYKAEDTRLGRTVALKFLPPALSLDPEAKGRFLQEARAASALEHPNICTIHEVGETADGRLYLAMPCYDGETLRQRISRGPLPVEEAAEIAEQIARGLAKAHRRGIVHRDIKPANLMVTADGLVKILDFGIATLAGSATSPDTHAGTPSYMSPEQARGEEVDARTDLWSLGVVLYEMLAGRRPYRGEHQQAIRYAHDHEEPPPLAELCPGVSAELARVAGRLLAKAPVERYADAAEVAADLRALRGESTAETSLRPAAPRRRWLQAALALLALLAVAALAAYLTGRRQPGGTVQAAFTQLTDLEGSETFPSLSPVDDLFLYTRADGGDLDIFRRKVGGGEAVNLTAGSPLDDTQPAFSPDGRRIAFRSEREGGGLFVMNADGSGVRRLADSGYNPAWSPDGATLLAATEGVSDPGIRRSNSELWRIDVATGAKRRLVGGEGDAVQPSWSPDGRRIAYWGLPPGSARRVIWTAAADGSDPVQVTDDPYLNWNPVWSHDGRLLYFASNRSGTMNLWRVPIDPATGELRGEPQAVTASTSPSALLSLSPDGRRILYAVDDRRSNIERFRFDPAAARAGGPPQAVTQGARLVRSGEVSPDGRQVVFHSTTPREDLFLVQADGTGLRQLTDDPAKDRHPRWSPDGGRIAFYSDRSGKYEAWVLHVADGRLEQLSETTGGALTDPLWSPDGRRLLCALGSRAAVFLDLARPLRQRLAGQLPPAGPGGAILTPLSWSRDGQLAGVVQKPDEWPLPGLVVHRLGSRRFERLTDRGSDPSWLSDGRLLYVEDGRVRVLDVTSRESADVLTPPPDSAYLAVSADERGGFLYAVREIDQGDVWMVTLE